MTRYETRARQKIGEHHGRLTIVEVKRRRRKKWGEFAWRWDYVCRCDCGRRAVVCYGNLTSKNNPTISCGCYNRERTREANRTRGRLGEKIYQAWRNMMRRCYDPANPSYRYYGGRGISVCERWHSLAYFRSDIPQPRNRHLSLDRIDNNGNYEPGNVRWATWKEQAANKRKYRTAAA